MRILNIITILFFFTFAGFAQTVQKGFVKEYNEKNQKAPLEGVEINVRSASSSVSDDTGGFSLNFITLKPGDKINVRAIRKSGYEIFNKDAIEQWNLNPQTPFTIVMIRSDRFKKICDNYYSKASVNYKKQYDGEIAKLNKLKADNRLKEEEYRQRLQEIQGNLDRQLDNLDNYVERFARIDLSELQEEEQEIIKLVQEGRFDEAIAKYEELNLVEKFINSYNLDKNGEISTAIDQLSQVHKDNIQKKDELLSAIDRQINALNLYGGAEMNKKISDILSNIADADSGNIDLQIKAGNYLYEYLSDFDNALKYFRQALAESLKQYGEKHYHTVRAYECIASVYSAQYETEAALENYNKAYEILSEISGSESDKITLLNDISFLYVKKKEYEKALEYCKIGETIISSGVKVDVTTKSSLYNNLGIIYMNQKDTSLSLKYYLLALKEFEESDEDVNNNLARLYPNIASLYFDMGDYVKSHDYHDKALALIEKIYGENNEAYALECWLMARLCSKESDFESALSYCNRALPIQIKVFGDNHPAIADTYQCFGEIYLNISEYEKALKYYSDALEILKNSSSTSSLAPVYYNIGLTYGYLNDNERALSFLAKSLDYSDDIHDMDAVYFEMARRYNSLCDYDNAIDYFHKSLEINQKMTEDRSTFIMDIYNNLGINHGLKQDFDNSLECFRQSLDLMRKSENPYMPDIAIAINNIATVYYLKEDYRESLNYFLEALDIREKSLGYDDLVTASSYSSLGSVYDNLQDYKTSLEYYNKALDILLRHNESNPDDINSLREEIKTVTNKLN